AMPSRTTFTSVLVLPTMTPSSFSAQEARAVCSLSVVSQSHPSNHESRELVSSSRWAALSTAGVVCSVVACGVVCVVASCVAGSVSSSSPDTRAEHMPTRIRTPMMMRPHFMHPPRFLAGGWYWASGVVMVEPFVGVELLVSGEGGGHVVGGQGQPDAGSLGAGGGLAGVGVDPAVDADLGAGAHDAGAVGELLGSDGLGGGGGGHGVLLGD